MKVLEILIPFAGGLGMFIYGMQVMAQGLENAAGDKMRSLLELLTKNKFLGVLLGVAITAVIQSSSATTVMVVGFVNAGMMNLQQAMGIIMGANIGTTVTGWLVSSTEWARLLSPAMLAPVAVIAGVIIMMTGKRYSVKELAKIIFGFGLLFIGISTMSGAVEPLKNNEAFCNIFLVLGHNPLLGIAAGALVTAVIQSSSASVGILQSLAAAGLVPVEAAVYIIMGQNIGTCITAILSGLGANRSARTAGLMHLLFNITGTVIFGTAAIIYFSAAQPLWLSDNISQTQISLVHTLFNVGTTLLLFPASGLIIRLAEAIGRPGKENAAAEESSLDKRLLETPGIAVQALRAELQHTGELVYRQLSSVKNMIDSPGSDKINDIKKREETVDRMCSEIFDFAIELTAMQISHREHIETAHILQVVSDMERISDQCENLAEFTEQIQSKNLCLSNIARDELRKFSEVCIEAYNNAVEAFFEDSEEGRSGAIEKEIEADHLETQYRLANVERLAGHRCEALAGTVYQDAIVSLERISDHARNIAEERYTERRG
ncbi:MAG: Na/Pi cotransporter family protein [Candidatus Limivicinus sp.]